MPMLPDPAHMDIIDKACISAFEAEEPVSVFSLCENIMDDPKLPHALPVSPLSDPCRIAHGRQQNKRRNGGNAAETAQNGAGARRNGAGGLLRTVRLLRRRCGRGNFCLRLAGSTSLSKTGWAAGNEMTARCLSAIASVEGPRCCKRVTYLTLSAALPAAREFLGLDLGEIPEHTCHHFSQSRECRGTACPFFPKKKKAG